MVGEQVSLREQVAERGFTAVWVVFRWVVATGLLIAYAAGLFEFPTSTASATFFAGALVFAIVSIVLPALKMALRQEAARAVWAALPVDLIGLVLLVRSTHHLEDPFYPILAGLAIYYAAISGRAVAVVVSLLVVTGYMGAHMSVGALNDVSVGWAVFLVAKAAVLPVVAWLVSDWMESQLAREGELRRSNDEVRYLNEELTRRLAELHIVTEITEVIHSTLDFDAIGPVVLDSLKKALDMPACSLMVIDKGRDETVFQASAGLEEAPSMVDHHTAVTSLSLTGEGEDTMLFTCSNIIEHNDLAVVFCCPVNRLEALSDDDKLVLNAVSSELVVAVENSRLYQLTKRLSITDELTGLRNYRFLQQRLDQEYERANRYNRYLSLLMLDIDHFKEFNDAHGHIAGDRALADLARIMLGCVREVDVVTRYGGEEFAVILPETDAAGAFVVAEKIREACAAHDFENGEGEPNVRATVSVGVATFPVHALDRESLLRQADDALYQAKHFGRDRVRAPRVSDRFAAGE